MRPDMQLDYAVFQLNPTRTRCELHISAQGMTYKLAAGLLQPFVAHLKAAEEQVAGGGYLVRLEPPDPGCAGWFTKGTMERFVRFVSTPELLERVSTIEMELLETENNIRMQSGDASKDSQYAEELLSKVAHSINSTGGMPSASEHLEKSAKDSSEGAKLDTAETTKQRLLRALEARCIMLEKELRVALARAIAAGFSIEHINDLIVFAETFGAKRLWGACSNFMSLCKTRQQSGVWQDDLKLSVAEVGKAEMAFSGNVVHHMGFRENLDLQGRGSRHDDLRRVSLPSEGRPLLDDGLEKLTRRGSLDELSGDFLQVVGRMRSSGMMEGANVDWSNNWQAPFGGANRPVSGEVQAGVAHFGVNNDLRDSESELKLPRGHQIMATWRGQPQNHPMHPLRHGPMHPSIPPSFGFPGLPVPGYSYPPYPGNPYTGHTYAEANGWQFPSPVAPPFWPHPMFNSTAAPGTNERGEVALPTFQKCEANHNTFSNNELHEELTPSMQKATSELSNVDELHGKPFSSTQKSDTDQPVVKEHHEEAPNSTQRPATDRSFNETSASTDSELHVESTQSPVSDLPVNDDTQQTVIIQDQLPMKNEREEETATDSLHDGDGEPYAEKTRRLPIRASSPSRRSASPLRKVQIGRSGSRRAVRNVNYVAQNIPEKIEAENNDRESSESWSEDNDEGKNDEKQKEQPVRARVQDVIGLFERKTDVGDSKSKPIRKEIGRRQSNNSVLKRWTDSSDFKKEASETEVSTAINRIRKGALVASADDISERGSNQLSVSGRKEERTSIVHRELAVAGKVKSCTEQQAFDEQPVARESIVAQKNPSNPESEVPNNHKTGGGYCNLSQRDQSSECDVLLTPDSSKELAGKSCNVLVDDDAQVLGTDMVDDIQFGREKTDVNESLNDGQENEDGSLEVNSEPTHSKKVSARDAKAKAMQLLLERRKAASGNRSGKSNPLAEAQLRAEKLRAYKAGLQKSKQEKDEEEKKRIEDLKSQRKDKIATRASPQGISSAQSPIARQAPTTAPLTGNRASPTVISHKLSSSSPRNSNNVSASSLSPTLPKSKGAAVNKLPRTPTGTPIANENALSFSMPSLSELKKESPRAMLTVRSSTGSQRLSQLKKNLKDADPNTSPKANGHSEEKRRSLPLALVRKGIPPAKDSKNEGSPVVRKPSKGTMTANKQQKKPGSFPASVKPKKPARETMEATSVSEQVDAANVAAVEVTMKLETGEGNEKQECNVDNTEASLDTNCSSLQQDVGTTEDDKGYAQIRALASSETEILGSTDDSLCLVDGELAISSEPLVTEHLKETEAPTVLLESCTGSMACIEGEYTEMECNKNGVDNYLASVAHVSPTDENSTTFKDLDTSREELNVPFFDELPSNLNVSTNEVPNSPPAEDYNPPHPLPSDSPLHIPKNLPRLHEAIQQAHSPEFIPGVSRSRKSHGDEPGSLRSSKDHAKGFKRLLLLGRKSSRSSSQHPADGVSGSMVSDAGDDGEDTRSNARKVGGGSAVTNTDSVTHQADKPRVEVYSGNSSSKGSRSFFSLSTFRGKGEGK